MRRGRPGSSRAHARRCFWTSDPRRRVRRITSFNSFFRAAAPSGDFADSGYDESESGAGARRGRTPHLRHHFPPRRGENHADGKAPSLRRRHSDGRCREGAQSRAPRHVRLDGGGKAARNFRDEFGHAVPLRRTRDQSSRHAGARRLLGRHLPRAHRRGRGRHGDRRGQGRGSADHQAPRSLPHAQHADHHLHQQARP